MSIIWTLRKYIDPIAHREEEAAQQRDRTVGRRQGVGEGDDDRVKSSGPEERRYECRVCGQRSDDEAYCSECLADTMEPIDKRS